MAIDDILISIVIFFGYMFSCILAHKVMLHGLGWTEAAESPLVVIWPVVLLLTVFLAWPIMAMLWLVNGGPLKLAKKVRRSRKSVREVK